MTIEEAAALLKEARRRWKENEIGTLEFSKEEGRIFQLFKQGNPRFFDSEWPQVQLKSRGL